MKHRLLPAGLALLLIAAANAQEARRVRPGELSGLQTAPVETAPKFIRKSASGGPPAETRREYLSKGTGSAKSAVVRINLSDGTVKEEPFVEVPLLFVKGKTELLDTNSRANLGDAIAEVRKVLAASPDARFRVEGHASAEGDGAVNERLAAARAEVIRQTLASTLRAEPSALHAEGRGTRDHTAPATAPEAQLQQDRRVLVVREK